MMAPFPRAWIIQAWEPVQHFWPGGGAVLPLHVKNRQETADNQGVLALSRAGISSASGQ